MPKMTAEKLEVAIVGAGPAGLFAAELLAGAGAKVTIFERLVSPARKFLLAGRGGLNLTHSEGRETFLARYGAARGWLAPGLDAFPPSALRAWADGLGEATFVGSSGRVFPQSFKASPLVRAWLARLRSAGVVLRTRHRLTAIGEGGRLSFETLDGPRQVRARAVLLALGGASWPRMGSDGAWVAMLEAKGIAVTPLEPANMGIEMGWSPAFATRFAGEPLKRIALTVGVRKAEGEAMVTATGLEGGAIYALSGPIRAALVTGRARLGIDLKPDLAAETVAQRIAGGRAKDSLSNLLKKRLGLAPQAIGLMREAAGGPLPREPGRLAELVKTMRLPIHAAASIERAISTAGGVNRDALSAEGELGRLPGVFVAGEMLDWEAPTGGYLLQATFATAVTAARGMARHCGLELNAPFAEHW